MHRDQADRLAAERTDLQRQVDALTAEWRVTRHGWAAVARDDALAGHGAIRRDKLEAGSLDRLDRSGQSSEAHIGRVHGADLAVEY